MFSVGADYGDPFGLLEREDVVVIFEEDSGVCCCRAQEGTDFWCVYAFFRAVEGDAGCVSPFEQF